MKSPWCSVSGALTVLVFSAAMARGQSPVQVEEFVYEEAPTPQCHASTIESLGDGTLVAAWFGGTHEKNPDVGIWVARKSPGGAWSSPVEVADGVQYATPGGEVRRHPCWNPVLYLPEGGPLMLFSKVGPSPREWWGMLSTSPDGGETWSTPRRLPEGILGPVKNKPIATADGSILCGSSTEEDGWRVHFERTDDLGRTWTRIGPINDGEAIGAIQPSLLTATDGTLIALGRSRQGRIWVSKSTDGGDSWGAMALTDLPNPNSGTDAVTLADGRHLLVYNATGRGRSPLNVAISDDDGESWRMVHTLESGPGEYSYPAVIQADDGMVHVTYTWKRERVKHVALDPDRL
ncbi:sialidase family protein [Tautonia plasticadhaerens]|uniref:Sialidase n=1 Tax=Tautonia plasticadhaerens TaxID=2527974 RepID=A0A518H1T5_9BACT|nr:sialidase family protein [Tautonia plasticadhaerens]QDV34793.1 Sialidase precursor [Tautonia plasticadhaerens]